MLVCKITLMISLDRRCIVSIKNKSIHAVSVASKEDEDDFSYSLKEIEKIPSKGYCAQFHRMARDSLVPEEGEIKLRWCPSEGICVVLRPFGQPPVEGLPNPL